MGRVMNTIKGDIVRGLLFVLLVAALLALAWAPVRAGLPPVEEPAIPVPASPGDYCDDYPDAAECQGDDEPVLGPGGCSSDATWACQAHRMFLPEVRA